MASSKAPAEAKLAFGVGVVLALVGALVDNGAFAWVTGIVAYVLFVFAMARAPLRYALMALMFVAFTLENPNDMPATGQYASPFFTLGALMTAHMNITTGQGWMFFSGLDLLLFTALGVAMVRRATNSSVDSRGRVKSPKVLKRLAYLSLAGSALILAWGMARGGVFQKALWQLEKVVYLPLIYLLAETAIRGSKDAVALARVVILGACYKAAFAIYVRNWAELLVPDKLDFAVTHHDSVLFALAVVILISTLIHRARAGAGRVLLMLSPLLVWGMLANDRRMVWVQIGLVFFVLYFAMPMTPIKKKIRKLVIRTSPLTALYVTVGWFMPTGLFKPVATLQSVVQPAKDISTMLRDIENYNITQTLRSSPVFGTGYGIGYVEYIPLPPMPHPLEAFLPHNSLLGLWFSAGVVGYTMQTLLWTTGVFFGVLAYRAAKRRIDRATALVCFGSVLMYLIQCYGDVGIGAWISVYCVAPALALGGKLAVETGAWQDGKTKARRPQAPVDEAARAQQGAG